MNLLLKAIPWVALAALASPVGTLGCSSPPPPVVAPPPPPVVAAPEPPPPEPPPPPAKPQLVGVTIKDGEIELPGEIEFDTSAATIKDSKSSRDVLNAVLKILQDNAILTKLRVEGHTDNVGSEASNQALSEKRTAAVVKWLVTKGIDGKRLESAGCGSRDPVVPNTSAENRAKNRRTEFDILEIEGKPADGAGPACAANPDRKP